MYNYKGDVWYVEQDGTKTKLCYKGYDKSTDSLRYGFKSQKHDKRIFRIKCSEDRGADRKRMDAGKTARGRKKGYIFDLESVQRK